MELESTGPSVPSVIYDENGNVIDSRDPSGEPIQFVFEEITWQQEIPWEEAAQKLEVAMYPFKKVRNRLYFSLAYFTVTGDFYWGVQSLWEPAETRGHNLISTQSGLRVSQLSVCSLCCCVLTTDL